MYLAYARTVPAAELQIGNIIKNPHFGYVEIDSCSAPIVWPSNLSFTAAPVEDKFRSKRISVDLQAQQPVLIYEFRPGLPEKVVLSAEECVAELGFEEAEFEIDGPEAREEVVEDDSYFA